MHFYKVVGLALSFVINAAGLSVPRNAAPEPVSPIAPKVFCDVVRGLVTVAKQQTQATPFCSSYLKIPAVTKTSTVTSFTTTVTKISTITSGSTTVNDATNTITVTVTATQTASATIKVTAITTQTINAVSYTTVTACASPVAVQKRAAAVAAKKPACFNNYVEGQILSSACKCLSLPTAGAAITTILSLPTTTATTVTVPLTIKATATATQTNTITTTVRNTVTEFTTITVQTTVFTATSATVALPTFTIYGIGGNNNGRSIRAEGVPYVGTEGSSTVLQFTTGNNNVLKVLNGPSAGRTAVTNPEAGGSDSYVLVGSNISGLVDLTCQVTYKNDGTCPLSCQGSRGSTSFDCGSTWRIGSDTDVEACSEFTPYAVGG